MKHIIALLFVLSVSVRGQSDGVIGTASRPITLPPSEAVFTIQVTADQTKTLDDVVPKLKDLGVGLENLLGVQVQQFGPSPSSFRIAFSFRLVVPLSRIKETNDKIAQIRRNEVDLDVQGFTSGVQAAANSFDELRKRLFPELLAEAKQRAQDLASGAGMSAGQVLALTESPTLLFAGPTSLTYSVTVRMSLQ